jgi:hypothetical protein
MPVRAVVVLLLVTGLGLAACDGDGDGDETTGADAPTTTPAGAPTTTAAPTTTTAPPAADSPDDLELPASASEVAEVILRVEPAVRSDVTPPEQLRVAGWEQQNAYRALSAHPEWVAEVQAALPPEVALIVAANLEAVTAVAILNQPQPMLPDWRIEAPLPPEVLIGYYREAEAASGIPWRYLAAIHLVETRLGRIRGNSSSGAQGPMQFIPSTWEAFGEGDINDNRDAILAAGRYLDSSGGPENMDRALFAYNNSDHYVRTIQNYAGLIGADERAYRGYYQWQVYYATVDGVLFLPEGYPAVPAVAVSGPASR